jgi:hypothetical protein
MELLEKERWLLVQGGLGVEGWLKEGRKKNLHAKQPRATKGSSVKEGGMIRIEMRNNRFVTKTLMGCFVVCFV